MNSSAIAVARRILVTGGAGFIGHRTVSALLEAHADTEVAILDNLSVGMPMPAPRQRLTAIEGDIRDRDRVARAIGEFRPDTIIHLAAVHHIPTCERRRAYALEVNVVGTELLLEAAETHGVSRFLLASSGAVYDWKNSELTEDSPLKPCDNYSLAKLTNESQLAYWADRTGGAGLTARIFNTIGHDDPNAHLVPDIIAQIPPGKGSVEIALGNLTPRRDYIHADDTARAIAGIAIAPELPAVGVFNVCSGEDVSVAELVTLLGDVMGIKISVTEDPARKRRVDRPSQLGAPEKLHKQTGFRISKSLRIALQDIVQHAGRTRPVTP